MTKYIDTTTLAYPLTEQDIRAANPSTCFESPFRAPPGYAQVFASPPPEHNPLTQYVREITPELTEKGHWEERWEVVSYPEDQVQVRISAIGHSMIEQIKVLRDQRVRDGGFKVGNKWFHSDTFSRTQQLGLLAMGANMPQGMTWKTMDGSFTPMTPAVAMQVFASGAAQDAANFGYAENLIAQVRAKVQSAEDPSTINIHAGWPPVFQDQQ